MPIPRFHLFELEDQSWFPNIIRDLATEYLQFMETKLELHQPVVPLLTRALRESGTTTVVDLCAGGGGPVVALLEELKEAGSPVSAPSSTRSIISRLTTRVRSCGQQFRRVNRSVSLKSRSAKSGSCA